MTNSQHGRCGTLPLALIAALLAAGCADPAVEQVQGETAFVGVTVIDVAAGEPVPAQTVVVDDGRIVRSRTERET